MALDMTTIKLAPHTKARLDNLKEHKRESYEEVIQKMLDILNTCRMNPLHARSLISTVDRRHKETLHRSAKEEHQP